MISRSKNLIKPSLSFILLAILFGILWIAGGASRADVVGQTVVRGAAWSSLIIMLLFGRWPVLARARPAWIFLAAAIVIALLQLFPLPAELWRSLPGRAILIGPASGETGAWRSLSLVPGATINALGALIVPFSVLILTTGLADRERAWLPSIVLILVVASMLVGILQVSGAGIDNPLVNDTPGIVSGTFANRNHFALFLALGFLFLPVWMFRGGHRLRWRGPIGLGMLLLFALMILASGSRAGMAFGVLAIGIASLMARHGLRREFRHAPRWVLPAVVAAAITLFASVVFISVVSERAFSVQRSLALDVEQDMRSRALSTVLEMTRAAFPVGNGLGSFDTMFRIHEPANLLKPTYFNHAHNDYLEVVLDAGLPGLLVLLAALAWWIASSVKAWRNGKKDGATLPVLGSAVLLLVFTASIFDYPARTPMIMAMIVLAAVWLSDPSDGRLPRSD